MMMRGFAAAAQAMILLGSGSNPGKRHELSMPLPDPPLADDIRIGVVVCRCNNSLGWLGEMDRFVGELKHEKDIYYTEIVTSACVPEQVAEIVAAVRAKGLTRLVIGSCVCCSLDFVCSACTDQRSRLKHNLFTAMGISRSMVVTFDIRGEALSFLQDDPVQGQSRFEGLLMQSLDTARNIKPLPPSVRKYNPAVAVLGQSETAVHGAQALAEMGINVIHLFDSLAVPKTERQQPNILCFNGADVGAISGTLGNFRLDISTGDSSRAVDVGAVIIGDRSVKKINYTGQVGCHDQAVVCAMQKQGTAGVPYLYPGMTSIAGLFVANPPGVRLSSRKKGRAAALLAAVAIMRGPERNRGYTVVVDEEMCRGCGRCGAVCPYHAVTFSENELGFWHASVDPSCCKGCGNCISVCPSGAVDSPQQNQEFLEKTLGTILLQESIN
jgi:heterodisulfide reductase subunit A-like polyferredoxin